MEGGAEKRQRIEALTPSQEERLKKEVMERLQSEMNIAMSRAFGEVLNKSQGDAKPLPAKGDQAEENRLTPRRK